MKDRGRIKNYKNILYLCTDLRANIFNILDLSVQSGLDIVQIRDYKIDFYSHIEFYFQLKKRYKDRIMIGINNNPYLVLRTGADILHLGQDDMPVTKARSIIGNNVIIGKSTHSIQQLEEGLNEDIDYLSFGPIWETPTKPNREAVGISILDKVLSINTNIPIFIIGGINLIRLNHLKSLYKNIKYVVVVREILDSDFPDLTVKSLKRILNNKYE